jgi:hypothetical protein
MARAARAADLRRADRAALRARRRARRGLRALPGRRRRGARRRRPRPRRAPLPALAKLEVDVRDGVQAALAQAEAALSWAAFETAEEALSRPRCIGRLRRAVLRVAVRRGGTAPHRPRAGGASRVAGRRPGRRTAARARRPGETRRHLGRGRERGRGRGLVAEASRTTPGTTAPPRPARGRRRRGGDHPRRAACGATAACSACTNDHGSARRRRRAPTRAP